MKMIQLPSKSILILGAALTVTPIVVNYLIEYYYKKKMKKLHDEVEAKRAFYYYHCIAFSIKNFDCRQHIIEYDPCGEKCSYNTLKTITSFILSSRHSISICMYVLTLKQISDALVEAHKRGVVVRIITDKTTVKIKSSRFAGLQHIHNIPVKIPPYSDTLMHHKFCLIDEKVQCQAKLLNGSFNMTLQGLCANFENVVFTNDLVMIRSFSDIFEELWVDFEAIKDIDIR